MSIDIRARELLSKIRKIKGAENAVIAGGAVRDVILGLEPKDYDFFIPGEGYRAVVETIGIDSKSHPDSVEYQTSMSTLKAVRQAEYEGLKVELMKEKLPNNEDFGRNVIKTFDYGICMAYYEGASLVREAEEFMTDKNNYHMTLYTLYHIADLPKSIARFNRLNEKLGGKYRFNCPYLKIDKPKEEKESKILDETWVEPPGFRVGLELRPAHRAPIFPLPQERHREVPPPQDLNANLWVDNLRFDDDF